MRKWKHWGVLVLALLTLGLTVACQSPSSQQEASASADCTPVEHGAGATCVPNSFERLVTLDSVTFESAIALGLQPIAAVTSSTSPHLQRYFNTVQRIGFQGDNPNLETVLSVNPDLILGLDHYQTIYAQISQIAPTVLVSFEHSGQWKDAFQAISEILGQAEARQQVTADYEQRLAEFKAAMGDRLQQTKVSVVRIYPDGVNLYLRDSFAGTVLQDAGLARPPAQDVGAAEAQGLFDNPIQVRISRELLSQADGDILFVWTSENDTRGNQDAQKKLEELQNDPVWKTLNAVQNDRVYFVPSYWIGFGPISANAVLDDLFKYLVETPES